MNKSHWLIISAFLLVVLGTIFSVVITYPNYYITSAFSSVMLALGGFLFGFVKGVEQLKKVQQ